MKKLFALLMALTMTVQLVMPAWADVVEDEPEEPLTAVEEVEETEEPTEEVEEVPEETEAEPEETEAETTEAAEEATEAESEPEETTVEPTEETAESTETSEEVEDEQVKVVVALIEALPSVEELEGMSEEEQLAAYEQIQGAFEAYSALSDEQKLLISGAEETFEALFAYFNNQVEPMAVHKHPVCGDADCTAHTQATFYSWDGVSGFNGSYIYLDQDAVRDDGISIRGSVTICLNGHTISTNGENPVFYVPSGSSLKICDCIGSGKLISDEGLYNSGSNAEIGIETDGGTVTVYSGTVEGNYAGIYADGGRVYTYGGQINSRSGDGIYLGETAKLTVKGGSITGYVGIRGNNTTTSIIMSAGSAAGSASSIYSEGELSLSGGTVEGRAAANTFYLYDSPTINFLYSPSAIMLKSKDDGTRTYTGDPFSIQVDDINKKIVVDNLTDPELASQITLVSMDGSIDGHITGRLEYTNQTLIQDIPIEKGLIENVKWALYDNGDFFLEGNGILPDYENQNLRGITPWTSYSSQIKKLYVGPGITRIGTNAFLNTGLEYISFGTASLSLGDNCFYECRNLTQIDFGTGTICPDEAVFAWCTSLKSVTIPANVKMNGQYSDDGSGYQLFFRCGLTSAVVECAYVGPFVFESCYSLNTVTFTDRNVKFYYVENGSGHPFNANGSGIIDVTAYGYLCSEVSALVAKSVDRLWLKLAFASIEGDTTEHTEQIVPAVPPTCIATGLTEGKVCSVCGTVLQVQTKVDVTGHTLKAVEAKESTCAEEGCAAHWACTVCGTTFSDAEGKTKTNPTVAKKAHTEVIDEAVDPTCTETGLTEGKHCSVCNEVLVAQKEVPTIDHSVDAWTVTRQATCAEEGEEQGTCSVCGNTATKAIPALGHDMTKTEAVEPTYWNAGNNTYYTCSRCGKVYKDEAGQAETTVEAETLEKLASVATGECGENLHWALTEDGTLTISGNGDMLNYSTSSVAPWYNKRTKILTVVVESGVTSIGNYAFYSCLKLSSVRLSDKLKSIGAYAFQECAKLVAMEIPANVTDIGYAAFNGCSSLENVVILEGITKIPNSAFSNCTNLKSVVLPNQLLSIGENAFENCASLNNLSIPTSVSSIGESAFSGCSSLTSVTIPEGIETINGGTFYNCTSLEKVILPESLLKISTLFVYYLRHYGAFENCTSLKDIVIPDSVSSIDGFSFYGCSNLVSVMIPEDVTIIGGGTFCNCTSLESVTLPEGLQKIRYYDSYPYGAFENCSSLKNIIIPDSVTSIENSSFKNCSGLTSIVISDNVTSIDNNVFSGCSSLVSLEIPDSVATIGENAFSGCTGLTSITIPDGVTSIGSSAFSECNRLTNVNIGESVRQIGSYAFRGCSSLTSICIPEEITSIEEGTYYDCTSLENITLPEGLLKIADSSGYQSYGVFQNCVSLKSIVIPDSVESIGSSAFKDCTGLTSMSIPGGVVNIGSSAFKGCTGLESVSISSSVRSIGNLAFDGCSKLLNIIIPDGVTSIGEDTFRGCSGLTSMSIGSGVTSIGAYAFEDCIGLTDVIIPDNVMSIGSSAFQGCSNLRNVDIGDGVTSIEEGAFYGCGSLVSISIPFGVVSIERATFVDCRSLSCVGISASVKNIDENAFYACSNLKDVYYGGDEVAWKQIEIENNNYYLTSAYIHYGQTHICTTHLIPAIAPTCTAAGNNAYYLCDACGRVYKDEQNREQTTVEEETLPALGHAMTLTEAKAATCTEDGNNAYYTCGNCHKVFLDEQGEKETTAQAEILPALGHTMAIVNTTAPTCTGKGNRLYYTCKTCGKSFKDKAGLEATTPAAEAVPALGHSMVKTEAVAPTCTEKGSNAYYTCDICEKVFKDAAGKQETTVEAEVLEALGHTMVLTETKDPTCTETGNKAYYTCKTCGKVYQDEAGEKETTIPAETLPALGHTMTKTEAVVPTCTEPGNNAYYTCGTCHKVYKDEAGKQATTAQAEIIPALGHTMAKSDAVAPTCTEKGSNAYYTCETCGKVFKDEAGKQETTVEAEVLETLGHTMALTEAKTPTCTETGNKAYYTCKTCGKVYQDEAGEKETTIPAETIPALGHTMTKTEAVEPTCTEAGTNAYYTCKVCGKVYKDAAGEQETTAQAEIVPALGHTMAKTEAVAPTHTTPGNNAYYTCKTCHKVFADAQGTTETTPEQEVLPRLPGIADGKSGALTWIISDEGTLTVSGKGRMPDYSGSALAPWYDYKDQIQAVVIEEGVLSIGAYAFFDCENLAEVQLPGSLKQLGKDCFVGCDSLKLLDMSGVPEKAAEKVTDLQGLVKLDASLEKLVGSNAAFHWELETIPGEADARTLAKLTGNKLEALHSGKFRLVCTEGYTGLTGSAEMEVQSFTVIRPEDHDRMISGETLELSAWAMPFETELSVRWSLEEDSKAYASISDAGVLTAKAVTEPVEITVLASPVNGEDTAEKTIRILPKTVGLSILADGEMTGHTLAVDLTEKRTLGLTAQIQPEGAVTTVTWTSEAPNIASVDDAGTVTLLKPGMAVIHAASTDGGASAELTLQVFYLDPTETLTLTAGSVELEQGEKTQLVLSGEDAIDPENVIFQIAQNQAQLAEVDAQGVVTAKSAAGKVTVVAALKNDPLMRKAELTLQLIQPRDKSPRLGSTTLTLNSNLTAGTTTALVESYNNTIQSVTLYDYNKTTKSYDSTPSETFAAEAEDGTLTVWAKEAQKNGTYQLKLTVDCLGGSYDYILQVKVANSLPKVTVKQIGKFDTFYLDSTAQLTATAAGCQVERLELKELKNTAAETFRMDEDGNIYYAESYTPDGKVVTNGKLLVYLEGYQVPVEKNVTIATTRTAPKLTLNPTASIINTAVEDPECRVKVLWNGKALDLTDADVTPDMSFAAVEAQGQYLIFRMTGATGGTAKLSLRLPGWAQAVSLTHKITVDTKLPTVKLGATTLKLNSLFTAQTAETAVWLTQGNLSIDTMGFVSAKPEGKNITLSFDPETDTIQAKFKEIPKAGTYSYTYTAYLEDGTPLKIGTLKVAVVATAPKVKLSAASVKLNRYLAGQEKATVKVTLTGGTDYQVTDFEGLPEYMSYDAETGNLTVVLPDGTFTGETCYLSPIVRDEESGQEVPLSTKLTLKVQTINTNKLTVSLSPKGKLDTVNPDSAIAYTVTKVNNCLGTVDGVSLEGTDGALFQADLDTTGTKPVVLLRLLPGESYATNKTYKVQFCFTVCGADVLSPILSVKVTQTALKVTAPKSAVYYLAQSGPMRCSLTANLPLESVSLSAKTAKEFQQALGGEENLRLVGNRLEFRLTNPSALKAGKSYSVQLELLPENAAENTKPTTVKLTVKVMK